MSLEELKATKEYLLNNLNKGFIKSSQAPFIALILFIKKLNSSLRFYINYYKLNLITRKDYYLLLLINETLMKIYRKKIFIKLDI